MLSYNPVTDFAPVARMTTQPSAFLVRTRLSGQNVAEFVAYAKANPKKLVGRLRLLERTGGHRAARKWAASRSSKCRTRACRRRSSTRSAAPSTSRSATSASAIAQVKGGKLKSLGVTSEKRNPLAPDWPTIAETYPGLRRHRLARDRGAPGTPRDIRIKLYDAAAKALAKKEVIEALASMGVTPALMTPDELAAYIPAEVKHWGEMIKEAGIQPE